MEPSASPSAESGESTSRGSLRDLAFLFLKLGTIAFGGPAAHVALMDDEVVRRRRWLSRQEFLDLLGATNLIPGPNSTEMAIHVGNRQAGWPGLLVAGACFILPAALLVTGFAWAYVNYGSLPQVQAVLYGVKPIIIAIVIQALIGLGRTALKTIFLAAIGLAASLLTFLGGNELLILFACGVVALIGKWLTGRPWKRSVGVLFAVSSWPFAPALGAAAGLAGTAAGFGLWPLFLFFVKVGSVLYGSGYVLLAFIRADLVQRWHWLTEQQLLDAIAVGQVTPGPVFTTATFIGYVLGGTPGAAIATIGIFAPAFVFVALSGPIVPRIRRSPLAGAFLDGVNAGSLALMVVVTYQLGRAALVDLTTLALAGGAALVLVLFRPNSVWLVLVGGILGIVLY